MLVVNVRSAVVLVYPDERDLRRAALVARVMCPNALPRSIVARSLCSSTLVGLSPRTDEHVGDYHTRDTSRSSRARRQWWVHSEPRSPRERRPPRGVSSVQSDAGRRRSAPHRAPLNQQPPRPRRSTSVPSTRFAIATTSCCGRPAPDCRRDVDAADRPRLGRLRPHRLGSTSGADELDAHDRDHPVLTGRPGRERPHEPHRIIGATSLAMGVLTVAVAVDLWLGTLRSGTSSSHVPVASQEFQHACASDDRVRHRPEARHPQRCRAERLAFSLARSVGPAVGTPLIAIFWCRE